MDAGEADTGPRGLEDWLALLEARHHTPIDLGLERCGEVWQRLGAPRPARRVITVAGTNGKGSTVAWIGAALDALGLRHGAYTSPHLLRFNERLRLAGRDVADDVLVEAFEAVESARGKTSLTYFEFTTLACLRIMADSDLDTAVLEVGLGGRLDTVNLVDTDLAVITPIGLDHQAFLGEDRQTIGREKAGILREGRPLVAGEPRPPASVLERARALACPVLLPGRDYDLVTDSDGGAVFQLGEEAIEVPDPAPCGEHQRGNLAAALAAVFTLYENRPETERLTRALRGVDIPGRLQSFGEAPEWLVDVGHNPLAAAVVAEALARRSEDAPVDVCVLAMLSDKDAESVARLLAPVVKEFHCAGLEADWRSQAGHELAGRVESVVSGDTVQAFPTVHGALAAARRKVQGRGRVLVFGSFHTAAEALAWLREERLLSDARQAVL